MNNSSGANLEVNCFLLRLYFKAQFTVLLQLEFLLTHGDAVASSIRGREAGHQLYSLRRVKRDLHT